MQAHERLVHGARGGALLLVVAALAVPSVATARPADVIVVNAPTVKLDPGANTVKLDAGANTVKLDAGANTVRLDPSANAVSQAPNQQVTSHVEMATVTGGSTACTIDNFELPTGELIALDSVHVDFGGSKLSDAPRASIRFSRKTGSTTYNIFDMGVSVGVPNAFGYATGAMPLNGIVVRRGTLAAAQIGDIFAVEACANRGAAAASSVEILLVGHSGG